jgi:hypothetical protein
VNIEDILDVGHQRPAPRHSGDGAGVGCVRCTILPVEPGTSWCRFCHPGQPKADIGPMLATLQIMAPESTTAMTTGMLQRWLDTQ